MTIMRTPLTSRHHIGNVLRSLLVYLAVAIGLWALSLYSYQAFHAVVELVSIGVAIALFLLAWNARQYGGESHLILLGTAYLAAAILDLAHTLAYKGMNVLPGSGTDLATQLWVAARYVQSVSLVLFVLLLGRTIKPSRILLCYSAMVALLLIAIFARVFPTTYLEGAGLTPFKITSEYVIACLMLVAAVLLFLRRKRLDVTTVVLLEVSIGVGFASELLFAPCTDVFGTANLIGHILKLLSFYFLGGAIIVNGLEHPYEVLFGNLSHSKEALRESEARLRAVMDVLPVGVYIGDVNGRIVDTNPAGRDLLEGMSSSSFSRARAGQLGAWRAKSGQRAQRDDWGLLRAIRRGEASTGEEADIVLSDGTRRRLLIHALPIRDENGSITGGVAVNVDITRLMEAEEALSRERDSLIGILDAMEDCIYIVNQDCDIEYVNPALVEAFGSVGGRKCYAYMHGRQDVCPWCPNERVFRGETVRWQWACPINARVYDVIETPLRRSSAGVAKLKILRDISQLVTATEELQRAHDELEERVRERTYELEEANRALSAEVTERARAEAALRRSEQRFRVALKSGDIAVAHVDRDLRYTWIYNPQPGLLSEDAVGHRDDELVPREGVAALMAVKREVIESESGVRREITMDLGEDTRTYDVLAEPLHDQTGAVVGATVAALDITERRRNHLALLQAEKLALAGKLSATFAHEIKNPLQAVIGCLGLAREAVAEGRDSSRYFEVISNELARLNRLVSQMRDLHRPPGDERRVLADVNALIERVLTLSEQEASSRGVEVVRNLDLRVPTLFLGVGQMEQVFLNLVLNAIDAMPDGGCLTVSTQNGEDSGVRIAVSDTGVGIPPDRVERIFEGFYSTKSDGLGLGLYISESIVRRHGGHIEVESSVGRGTTFTVWLPRDQHVDV